MGVCQVCERSSTCSLPAARLLPPPAHSLSHTHIQSMHACVAHVKQAAQERLTRSCCAHKRTHADRVRELSAAAEPAMSYGVGPEGHTRVAEVRAAAERARKQREQFMVVRAVVRTCTHALCTARIRHSCTPRTHTQRSIQPLRHACVSADTANKLPLLAHAENLVHRGAQAHRQLPCLRGRQGQRLCGKGAAEWCVCCVLQAAACVLSCVCCVCVSTSIHSYLTLHR